MVCPYAERKGPIVICGVTGSKVNPIAFPCLTDRYQRCKYYKRAGEEKAVEERREEKPPAPKPARPEAMPVVKPSPREKPLAKGRGETKGITIDGRRPFTCLECMYYGEKTKTCLLLSVEVTNPYDPPCTRT